MTGIVAPRLTLRPLDAEELGWYADDPEKLSERIGARTDAAAPAFFRTFVLKQRERVLADPRNRLWHTFWLMIDDARGVAVGSIDFKHVPAGRSVEIGYGVEPAERGKGYATEAVLALSAYAFGTGRVDAVTAETEAGNAASERVLAKAGFTQFERRGTSSWWRLDRPVRGPRPRP